ncbi:MAG: winged helix-turn-helix domain-containing protein [Candidatus Limivicinus sp.]|jgi:DNA-binding response OmpR family regulator
MRKNVELLNMNSALQNWLIKNLKNAPPSLPGSGELCNALENLSQGESSSLLLKSTDSQKTAKTDEQIVSGELTIRANSRQVFRAGEEIQLTPKEFDILQLLARSKGKVFTKEEIYNAVWEGGYLLDDSNIMAFIRKIRKKIEPDPDKPSYILTVWGKGYKFRNT